MKCVKCYSIPNLCSKCYEAALQAKYSQQTKNENQLRNINSKIAQYQNQYCFKNESSQFQSKQKILKKKYLQEKIAEKKQQIKNQIQQQSLIKELIQQKQTILDLLSNSKKNLSQIVSNTIEKIKILKEKNLILRKKNLNYKITKCKDVINALIKQSDQSIVMKSLQIGQTDQIMIKDIYGFNDFFLVTKSEAIMKKDQKIIDKRITEIVKNHCLALINLQKILQFWVPFDSSKILKQIASDQQQIKLKALGFFQANLQYLFHSLSIQDRPFLCLSKFILKQFVQSNQQRMKFSKPEWTTNLINLKSEYIQQSKQIQQNYESSYLPPLAVIKSNSDEDDQKFEILQLSIKRIIIIQFLSINQQTNNSLQQH